MAVLVPDANVGFAAPVQTSLRAWLGLGALLFGAVLLRAGGAPVAEVWRGVNPDLLSGGLFAALEAEGAFGSRPTPPRARASYADLSKGRPPAVLDARVGANIRLGDDPDALPATQRGQAEPHLVRSIANPDLLLATFQEGRFFDSGAVGNGYAVSRDGGLTWTRGLVPALTTASGGRFNRATDPVAGAGPQGELYLQALASVSGAFATAAVVVSRSIDGGTTWSAPATVFESTSSLLGPDKNWLAVNDYAGTPTAGRLVSTWSNFIRNTTGATLGIPLVASVSDDRGVTWSSPVELTPQGSLHQGTQPVFLPDGTLAVVYIAFLDPNNVSRFSIHCQHSPDGGRTFPRAASTIVAAVAGWDDPELRDGVFLPSAAVARQTGEIFVTYTAVVGGSPRVMVTKSADRGATWTAPVVASDQPAGVSVMNPAVAASPDGRTVSVFFIDKRDAPGGRGFVDHYAALSFDGGATWQPNLRLSEMSSDIRFGAATSRGIMLGDYLGLAPALTADQPCVAIWCDTRTGDADPFTVRLAARPTADIEAWQVAHGIADLGADLDGDGHSARLEYALGNDPRRAESGEALVLERSGDTGVKFFWAQRAGTSRLLVNVSPSQGNDPTASTTPVLTGRESFFAPELLPAVPTRAGTAWTGYPAGIVAALPVRAQFGAERAGEESAFLGTDSRLVNLSTRGRSGTGANQMIVGFVLNGNRTMLVRAAGPALAGLGVAGALTDPRLTLGAPASDLERVNNNWQDGGGGATAALFAQAGAFPFPASSLDAALALALGAQSYTAVVSDVTNTGGIALVEAYDTTGGPPAAARLINLSTRGDAGTGDNALIAGFVLGGTQPRRVLLRAIGPSLAAFNLTGTLADPVLTLFRGGTRLAINDDWEISRSSAAIAATAQRVGAFALRAASLDAALLVTLAPGAYTAIITSADGGTGLALIEVYDAD